jgi:hypothetical protein
LEQNSPKTDYLINFKRRFFYTKKRLQRSALFIIILYLGCYFGNNGSFLNNGVGSGGFLLGCVGDLRQGSFVDDGGNGGGGGGVQQLVPDPLQLLLQAVAQLLRFLLQLLVLALRVYRRSNGQSPGVGRRRDRGHAHQQAESAGGRGILLLCDQRKYRSQIQWVYFLQSPSI